MHGERCSPVVINYIHHDLLLLSLLLCMHVSEEIVVLLVQYTEVKKAKIQSYCVNFKQETCYMGKGKSLNIE